MRTVLRQFSTLFLLFAHAASCAVSAADLTNRSSQATGAVVIPFQYRRGHVLIPAGVAGTNSQPFILDTGYSMTMLPAGLGDTLQLRHNGHVTIVGIAGEEQASVFEGPLMNFTGLTWTSRRVGGFPRPEPGSNRNRWREGILGSGFFRRFVVQIDQRAKTVSLENPESFSYSGDGGILPLRFKRGSNTPIVSASLNAASGHEVKGDFEVDTGCDSSLCLASDFSEKNHLVPPDSRSSSRSGVGGGTRTRASRLDSLDLGPMRIERPSAEFFVEGSPAAEGLAGHIGLEAFRDFNAIFDYSRQRLILERLPKRH